MNFDQLPETSRLGNVAPKQESFLIEQGGWFRATSPQDKGPSLENTPMIKLTESLKPMHNIHRKSYILRVAAFGIYSRWTDSWWVLYPRWRMMTHGRGIEGEGLPFSVGPGALMGFKRGGPSPPILLGCSECEPSKFVVQPTSTKGR